MTTRRYVLFHRLSAAPAADLAAITQQAGVQVVDRTTDRAFLVEASEEVIMKLRTKLPGWVIEEESILPPPS